MAISAEGWYNQHMIEDRLKTLEEQIAGSANLPEETRAELLRLLASLRSEIAALPSARADDAHSATRFAEASAYEATRSPVQPQLLDAALSGLKGSVERFETSHPELAAILNRLSIVLANMGM